MEQNHDLPVHVPDGYALVPLGGGQAHRRPTDDYTVSVPPYDPTKPVEVWWSRIMRWPRRGAKSFLYLTYSWKISAATAAVCLVAYLVLSAYLYR